jgi:hypothetical protein
MRLVFLAGLSLGCGFSFGCGSTVTEVPPDSSGATTSGAGGGGPASTSSSAGTGGGATSSVGAGGSGGDAGAGGGDPATCAGLDYCSCTANAACAVVAEDCFCACGVEACEPDCDCDCSGGAYLGCAPTSIWNPGALEGIWLIGWSGGAHHFSWVRIESDYALTLADGAALSSNLPYYQCNGAGTWMLTAKPETVGLQLPGDCGFSSLTFTQWTGTPEWPEGCLQQATVEDNLLGTQLMACRFPPSQCNADMSACDDPLAP